MASLEGEVSGRFQVLGVRFQEERVRFLIGETIYATLSSSHLMRGSRDNRNDAIDPGTSVQVPRPG